METCINSKLVEAMRVWRSTGEAQQEGIDWSPTSHAWLNAFPEFGEYLSSLPEVMDRDSLRFLCSKKNAGVVEKFLTVMIWGYGNLGYGTYRVSKMLSYENSVEILTAASVLAGKGNPKSAYKYLMDNRIPVLGPSYASKFICFNTPKEVSAPILDSLILLWIKKYASKDFEGLSISKMNWNYDTYSFYCDWIQDHALVGACSPDEVELVLFRLSELEFSKNSAWVGK